MRGMALASALAGIALAGCMPQNEPAEQQVQRIIPTPALDNVQACVADVDISPAGFSRGAAYRH